MCFFNYLVVMVAGHMRAPREHIKPQPLELSVIISLNQSLRDKSLEEKIQWIRKRPQKRSATCLA